MECPLNQEELELYEKLKGFMLPKRIYEYYIKNVKDKRDCSRKEVKSRLIKSSILGYRRCKDGNRIQVRYGCLYIVIDLEKEKFAYIENDREHPRELYKNRVKERWLKEELGLIEKRIEFKNGSVIEAVKCENIVRSKIKVLDFLKGILVGGN